MQLEIIKQQSLDNYNVNEISLFQLLDKDTLILASERDTKLFIAKTDQLDNPDILSIAFKSVQSFALQDSKQEWTWPNTMPMPKYLCFLVSGKHLAL